jgi:hypothetical protein
MNRPGTQALFLEGRSVLGEAIGADVASNAPAAALAYPSESPDSLFDMLGGPVSCSQFAFIPDNQSINPLDSLPGLNLFLGVDDAF